MITSSNILVAVVVVVVYDGRFLGSDARGICIIYIYIVNIICIWRKISWRRRSVNIYNIYCVYNVYIKEDFWAQTLGQYVLYILCI